MRRLVRAGPLVFRDPLLLCGTLYLLLWSDASGFLRIGLYAAVLHELGHILVYLALFRRLPVIEVTMTGLCMRTRGQALTRGQTFLLAAAGPGTNALLAAVWAVRMEQYAAIRDSAFLAANVLTGAFNLLPIPPLDGAQSRSRGSAPPLIPVPPRRSGTPGSGRSSCGRGPQFWPC